jgi:hypothetical protein
LGGITEFLNAGRHGGIWSRPYCRWTQRLMAAVLLLFKKAITERNGKNSK